MFRPLIPVCLWWAVCIWAGVPEAFQLKNWPGAEALEGAPSPALAESARQSPATFPRLPGANPYVLYDAMLRVEPDGYILVYDKNEDRQKRGPKAVSEWVDTFPSVELAAMAEGPGSLTFALVRGGDARLPALDAAAKRAGIVAIAPNYQRFFHEVPNDPRFDQQWSLSNTGQTGGVAGADIRFIEARAAASAGEEVIVAVIDSGIAVDHPDLIPNLWVNRGETPENGIDDDGNGYIDDVYGVDLFNYTADVYDFFGHGTHVAGTVAAAIDNGEGIAGVASNAKIMVIASNLSDFSAIEAINYAVAHGARIINASWGGPASSEPLRMAIAEAGNQGVLFVTSAGNTGTDMETLPNYPAAYDEPNIVAVAATTHADTLADFSTYSSLSVDLAAPGEDIVSTYLFQKDLLAYDFEGLTDGALPEGYRQEGDLWRSVTTDGETRLVAELSASPTETTTYYLEIPEIPEPDSDNQLSMRFSGLYGEGISGTIDLWSIPQQAWLSFYNLPDTNGLEDEAFLQIFASGKLRFSLTVEAGEDRALYVTLDDVTVFTEIMETGQSEGLEPAYRFNSGTSMASPHVAGVAAMILGQNPDMSNTELIMRLLAGGAPSDVPVSSARRLDAMGALDPNRQLHFINQIPETIMNTDEIKLQWSFIDQPDCDMTLSMWQDGVQAEVLARGLKGYEYQAFLPDIGAGEGFNFRLGGCGSVIESPVFILTPTIYHDFEDPAMARYLVESYDLSGDGRINRSEADRIASINVSGRGVKDIGDLSVFPRLGWLSAENNSLETFPDTATSTNLVELFLGHNRLTEVGPLPSSLLRLGLNNNRLTGLPDLTGLVNLTDVYLYNNRLSAFPALAEAKSFGLFFVGGNQIRAIPPADNQGFFSVRGNFIETIPDIAAGPHILDFSYNRLTELPALPDGLFELYCDGNQLTSLPGLPEGLIRLSYSHNPIEQQPALDHIRILNVIGANHTNMTELFSLEPFRQVDMLHVYGNDFGADDCADLTMLTASPPHGLLPLVYGGMANDGLVFGPPPGGALPDCAGLPANRQVIGDLRFDLSRGQLSWSGGGDALREIDHYRIDLGEEVSAETPTTRFRFPDSARNQDLTLTPVYGDGREGSAVTVTVPERAETHHRWSLFETVPDDWQGIALVNPGETEIEIEAVIHDMHGAPTATTSMMLPAGARRKGVVTDLLPEAIGMPAFAVRWSAREPFGLLVLDGNADRLVGHTGEEHGDRGTILLPRAREGNGFTARLFSTGADLTLTAYDVGGSALETVGMLTQGFASSDPRAWFSPEVRDAVAAIDWEASSPITLQLVVHNDRWFPVYESMSTMARPALRGAFDIIRLRSLVGFEIDGAIMFHNPGDTPVLIRLQGKTNDGRTMGEEGLRLEARETRWYNPTILLFKMQEATAFAWRASAPIISHIEESVLSRTPDQPFDVGPVTNLQTDIATSSPVRARAFLVPHVPTNEDWQTCLTLANPNDENLLVEAVLRDEQGMELRRTDLILAAHTSFRATMGDLFPEAGKGASLLLELPTVADLCGTVCWSTRKTRGARAMIPLIALD